MLKDIGEGGPGRPSSPDNLLRLAKEVEPGSILPELALRLLADPDRTLLVRDVLLRQLADADPHMTSLLGAIRAMADQIVQVPPGTAPEIVKAIEAARRVAKDRFDQEYSVADTLSAGRALPVRPSSRCRVLAAC